MGFEAWSLIAGGRVTGESCRRTISEQKVRRRDGLLG